LLKKSSPFRTSFLNLAQKPEVAKRLAAFLDETRNSARSRQAEWCLRNDGPQWTKREMTSRPVETSLNPSGLLLTISTLMASVL
jgi:hypothetical protein